MSDPQPLPEPMPMLRLKPYLVREDGAGYGTQVVLARSFAEALATWKQWVVPTDCVPNRDPDSVEEIACDQVLVAAPAAGVVADLLARRPIDYTAEDVDDSEHLTYVLPGLPQDRGLA